MLATIELTLLSSEAHTWAMVSGPKICSSLYEALIFMIDYEIYDLIYQTYLILSRQLTNKLKKIKIKLKKKKS